MPKGKLRLLPKCTHSFRHEWHMRIGCWRFAELNRRRRDGLEGLADERGARVALRGALRPGAGKRSFNFAFRPIPLKNSVRGRVSRQRCLGDERVPRGTTVIAGSAASSGRHRGRTLLSFEQPLGHSSQVLSCRSEQELVVRAGQSSQTQSIELEDAFEMREQYLHLLAIAS